MSDFFEDVFTGQLIEAPKTRFHRRSTLEKLLECPRKFAAIHIDKDTRDGSYLTEFGIACHTVMADYVNELRHNKQWSFPDYLVSEAEKGDPRFQPEMRDILKRCAYNINFPPNDILAVEHTFRTEADMPAGQGYEQTLDVLWKKDDYLIVDDWKFGYADWTESTARASIQARWACWLLSVQPDYSDVDLFVFRFRRMRSGAMPIEARFTRKQLAGTSMHIGQTIMKLISMEGSKNFPAISGDWCSYCPIIQACPIRLANPAETHFNINEALNADPKAFAERVFMMETILKLRKKALKAHVEANGPVRFGNMQWGIEQSMRTSFDVSEVKE